MQNAEICEDSLLSAFHTESRTSYANVMQYDKI